MINRTRYIKNNTGTTKTYLGVPVAAGDFYLIPVDKYASYSNLDNLLEDIASGDASISYNGSTVISGVAEQINALKGYEAVVDSDGSPIHRVKITKEGWHYQMYGIGVQTAVLDSLTIKDKDNNTLAHGTLKVYDSNDNELTTQLDIDTLGVKTVLDWEPTWDYELIGGKIFQQVSPGTDINVHVVAVPDLTEAQGGSIPFVSNVNLLFIGTEGSVDTDGRTAKRLNYDATYHTNKLRFIFYHDILVKHRLQINLELFRA